MTKKIVEIPIGLDSKGYTLERHIIEAMIWLTSPEAFIDIAMPGDGVQLQSIKHLVVLMFWNVNTSKGFPKADVELAEISVRMGSGVAMIPVILRNIYDCSQHYKCFQDARNDEAANVPNAPIELKCMMLIAAQVYKYVEVLGTTFAMRATGKDKEFRSQIEPALHNNN